MMVTNRLLPVAVFLTVSTASASNKLICANNGKLIQGVANFSNLPNDTFGQPFDFLNLTNIDGESCECPENFTGVACDHAYKVCNEGQHHCFHGGECHPKVIGADNDEDFVCDCRNAYNSTTNIHYVGKHCQLAASANGECTDEIPSYCMNNGMCDSTRPGYCICPSGKVGPRCEFSFDDVPICALPCHSGHCVIGVRNSSTAEEHVPSMFVNEDFQHCVCPHGYSGLLCDVEVLSCGDTYCFSGSECVQVTDTTGTKRGYCNCTAAATSTTSFAGRYCEHESTSFCEKQPTLNGHQFCTNDGKCPVPSNGIGECQCPDNFSGAYCEIDERSPNTDYFKDCNLNCQNDGVCRRGDKDFGMLLGFGPDIGHLIDKSHNQLSLEHCQCSKGYTGVLCEHMVEVCGAAEHVCFHGSECIPKEGGDFECNCSSAEMLTVGEYCQHTEDTNATIRCNDDSKTPFCVNGGRCTYSQTGCDCSTANGFHGDHCELRTAVVPATPISPPQPKSAAADTMPKSGIDVGVVIAGFISYFVTGCLFIFAVIVIRRRAENSEFSRTEPECTQDVFADTNLSDVQIT